MIWKTGLSPSAESYGALSEEVSIYRTWEEVGQACSSFPSSQLTLLSAPIFKWTSVKINSKLVHVTVKVYI